nr:MAG TPA: hypothetical protein [Caudoviricetes sp.]
MRLPNASSIAAISFMESSELTTRLIYLHNIYLKYNVQITLPEQHMS